jgi:hypothetical protein
LKGLTGRDMYDILSAIDQLLLAGFLLFMKQSVLLPTLAALSYIITTLVSPTPSPASTTPVVTPIQDRIHVAKKDESLTELAKMYYGDEEYWTTIWNDNQSIINPSIIDVGTKVKIRTIKPLAVENVDEKLMKRLMEDGSELDENLAFVEAGEEKSEPIPTTIPVELTSTPTPLLIREGNNTNFDAVYQAAGDQFGVPWQILYGLHLTETGLRDGYIMNGYGSGARGPMQFMPGTFNAYAVDGNGDGVTDIDNAVDAIYTAANYLVKHGGVTPGLRSYGGNTAGVLAAACRRGYCQ